MASSQNLPPHVAPAGNISSAPAEVEKKSVVKSLYAIGGMGVGCCLVLSLMMQHLLGFKQERDRSPLAIEVEELLGGKVCGKVEAHDQTAAGQRVTTLQFRLLAGLQKRRQIDAIAPFVWQRAALMPEPPDLLRFVVDDDGGGAAESIELRRPAFAPPPARPTKAPAAPVPPPEAVPARPTGH
jgi:hypothetical protein